MIHEIFMFTINKDSSKRTKERIKQHGPKFAVKATRSVQSLGMSFLLESLKSDWFGWIPVREVDWSEINDN